MKEFKLSNMSLANRTTMWILLVMISIMGINAYLSTPKERMPDIPIPYYSITTLAPGTAAGDVENVYTIPIEKQLKGINGIKTVSCQSLQDFSSIFIEFDVNVNKTNAYLDLKKAIDLAKEDLPAQMYQEPQLTEIEVTDIPVCFVNVIGEMNENALREHAKDLQDLIEGVPEVSKVDMVGDREREILVNVDLHKMQASGITFKIITDAILNENVSMSGGTLEESGLKRNIRVVGEFKNIKQIADLMLKNGVYLRDIAEVKDGFKDAQSFSRLNGQDIITLNVIKKSGTNLIDAIDNIKQILKDYNATAPANLKVILTNDTSVPTQASVDNLFNTMILSIVVVILVLMFFMGVRNAFNSGTAIPISILIAFIIVPMVGYTLNNMVLMAFIIVLGMVVDNSIVIVENIHTYAFKHPEEDRLTQIRRAVGQVAVPVFTGTLTTIAPFFPLLFWPGIMGKFFIYIPVVVIITLVASIFSAYMFNPLISYLGRSADDNKKLTAPQIRKRAVLICVLFVIAVLLYWSHNMLFANIIVMGLLCYLLYKLIVKRSINYFQKHILPAFTGGYERMLHYLIEGKRAYWVSSLSLFIVVITILTFSFFKTPKIILFPDSDPDDVYVYITMPEGTHIDVTNAETKLIEARINKVLGKYDSTGVVDPNAKGNPDVKTVVTNVGIGSGASVFDRSQNDKLAKLTVSFVDYEKRVTPNTTVDYAQMFRENLKDLQDVDIFVDYRKMGPPTKDPISLEIQGDNILQLISIAQAVKNKIEDANIPGVDKLKVDVKLDRPELNISVDRVKAAKEGFNTKKIAEALRNAVYGNEVSKFRDDEDEYQIRVRLEKDQRTNLSTLMSQTITVDGREIPISSVARINPETTYGSVNRKDFKRMIIVSSKVLAGYNSNEVVNQVKEIAAKYKMPPGYKMLNDGEQADQMEQAKFLLWALMMAVFLIFFVMVVQFNSLKQPLIIMCQIILAYFVIILVSTIFQIEFSIVMSGLALVAVGGVVATNGIILTDHLDSYTDTMGNMKEAVVLAAKSRLVPVLLTAASTILGLLPLVLEVNIDLQGLFTHLQPHFYFGGPTASFWKPMAMTLTVGLGFSTILTLIIEPAMYYIFIAKGKGRARDAAALLEQASNDNLNADVPSESVE